MRSATIGAAAVLTGCTTQEKTAQVGGATPGAPSPAQAALAAPPLADELDVVKRAKGPVMTLLDEFYKVGPGPSSSHTIGPMRIT
jgi:L-serine dehydratase